MELARLTFFRSRLLRAASRFWANLLII
uniref:Uncharacterized protein n=1 Tax=Oryza meridionalis TaxID=40149 RepID=A0A0E0D597_9ORYZ